MYNLAPIVNNVLCTSFVKKVELMLHVLTMKKSNKTKGKDQCIATDF